ncbi:hypothetical protein [Klenkia taihuensis]|uniref:Uncharacterized protein n=1 Tax=Klenkia taihuensis TaxID=1225127 RepID=A0A1I1MY67_9ACTN|nr:hypothetical protein [Klenkia taihuensis]GHE12369.1 hypothetical protein GCM10011381_29940 [Klenkia taihuensis]SFC90394.1 hypothetical protein SAMN05661030_1894 [Klenkia taihuensis]
MLRARSRAALATVVLAVLAALALSVADVVGTTSTTEERISVPLWLVGWVVLGWAALLGVVTLVRLLRAGRRRDAAVAALGLACVVVVAVAHPVAGSGGGAA